MFILSAFLLAHPFVYLTPEDLRKIGGVDSIRRPSHFRSPVKSLPVKREKVPAKKAPAEDAIKVEFWRDSPPRSEVKKIKTPTSAREFARERGYRVFFCGNNRVVLVKTLKAVLRFKPDFNVDGISELVAGEWKSLSVIIYPEENNTVVSVKGKSRDVDEFIKTVKSLYLNSIVSVSVYPPRELVCNR